MSVLSAHLAGPLLARRVLVVVMAALLLAGVTIAGPAVGGGAAVPVAGAVAGAGSAAAAAYTAPVQGQLQVLRGFDPPATRYGAGHLGVDLRVPPGAGVIVAAGAGVVRFAGPVAGRGVIVVAHPDGVTTEYEPVRPLVKAGQPVQRGQPIGRLAGRHPGCPGRCLHWGARRDTAYLDPLGLLRPLGPLALLPWRG